MNKIAVAVVFLLVISIGLSIDATDFYPKLIDYEQSLTTATLTYEYCNPYSESISLSKALENSYYTFQNENHIPELYDAKFEIKVNRTYSSPIYKTKIMEYTLNDTTKNIYKTDIIDIVGYENKSRMVLEKLTDNILDAKRCVEIRHTAKSSPRYHYTSPIDIVPKTDIAEIEKDMRLTENKDMSNDDSVERSEWILWTVYWQNSSIVNVTNPYAWSYPAFPIEFTMELPYDSDGTELRVACDGSEVDFACIKTAPKTFDIRMFVSLDPLSSNDSCNVYYNPNIAVANSSKKWNDMYWNFDFNFSDHIYDWEDYFDNTTNWYLSDETASIGGYALKSNTTVAIFIKNISHSFPNRAYSEYLMNTLSDSGLLYANDKNYPLFDEYVSFVNFDGWWNRKLEFNRYDNAVRNILNTTSYNSNLLNWRKYTNTWMPTGRHEHNARYIGNETLIESLVYHDSAYTNGYTAFFMYPSQSFSGFKWRYNGDNVSVTLSGNGVITLVEDYPLGNATSMQIDWGTPRESYCVNSQTLQSDWRVIINLQAYVKSSQVLCQHGCVDGACSNSPETEAMNDFWKYAIFIVFFIAVILVYLYIRR